MSCGMGRSLDLFQKYRTRYRVFEPKFYSILYPIHFKYNSINNSEKQTVRKPCYPNQLQHFRNFSLQGIDKYYTNLYQSISQSEAAAFTKSCFIELHDVTGLPWWGTIILATAGIKFLVSLPSQIYVHSLLSRIFFVNQEVASKEDEFKEKTLRKAKDENWTKNKAFLYYKAELNTYRSGLYVKYNCHPLKPLVIRFAELPIWILMSFNLRNIARDINKNSLDAVTVFLQFQVGGPFWATNLALPDPTFILPAVASLTSLLIIQIGVLSNVGVQSFLTKSLNNALRIISIITFPIAINMPACVTLYWATSVLLGLSQNLLLLSPRVRRYFNIQKTPKELEKPYSHIMGKLLGKV